MKLPVRAILATGAAGAMAFGVVELVGLAHLIIALPVAAIAALGTGGGVFLMSKPENTTALLTDQSKPEPEPTPAPLSERVAKMASRAGVSHDELNAAIKMGRLKMKTLRELSETVGNPNVKREIGKIALLGDTIVDGFAEDPKDVRLARAWLNTFLDQFIEVIEQYAQLNRTGARSVDAQRVMAKFPKICDNFKAATEHLKKSLADNDLAATEINLQVFDEMISRETVK